MSRMESVTRLAMVPAGTNRISQEALHAGSTILEEFEDKRYGLLTAQMQSGKTTTYYFVAAEMIRLGKVEHVIIFSGNAEKELKEQTEVTAARKFGRMYRKWLRENEIEMDDEMDERVTDIINVSRISVVWGPTHLAKYCGETRNTLYIWDESHFAQNAEMKPASFIAKIAASGDGNKYFLQERNNYFLSVSATPFSEVSNIFHGEQDKFVAHLEAGEGYHSVEKMLDTGCIIGFSDWRVCLDENMKLRNAQSNKKYAIVRLWKKDIEEGEQIARRNGWIVQHHNADNRFDIDLMKDEPKENTVIFLKGMFRMGKEVDKSHVDFCIESSKDSKTDVVLQGLLGRMCGYHSFTGVRVFLNNKIMNSGELERYVGWTRREEIMPRRANNLVTVKDDRNSPYPHHIIPIKISKNDFIVNGSEDVSPKVDRFYFVTSVITAIVNNRMENYNTEEQTAEIQDQVVAFNPNQFEIRDVGRGKEGVTPFCRRDAPKNLYESMKTRQAGGMGTTNGIRKEGGIIVIWYFSASFPEYQIQQGDVFVVAKTRSSPVIEEMMKTTRKEVFCRTREEIQPQEPLFQEPLVQTREYAQVDIAPGAGELNLVATGELNRDVVVEIISDVDILECREIERALIQLGANDSKYTKKWLRDSKELLQRLTLCATPKSVKKERVVKKRRPPQEVLREGDVLFVKSHRELRGIWRNGKFVDGDEFSTLNKLCVYHHKERLNKACPNAWTAYGLERQTGEIILDLDTVFLLP